MLKVWTGLQLNPSLSARPRRITRVSITIQLPGPIWTHHVQKYISAPRSRPQQALELIIALNLNGAIKCWPSSTVVTMHERNPYKIPPDFDSLARAYPPLRPQSVLLSSSAFCFSSLHPPLRIESSARQTTGRPPSISTMKLPKGRSYHLSNSIHFISITQAANTGTTTS